MATMAGVERAKTGNKRNRQAEIKKKTDFFFLKKVNFRPVNDSAQLLRLLHTHGTHPKSFCPKVKRGFGMEDRPWNVIRQTMWLCHIQAGDSFVTAQLQRRVPDALLCPKVVSRHIQRIAVHLQCQHYVRQMFRGVKTQPSSNKSVNIASVLFIRKPIQIFRPAEKTLCVPAPHDE